jgi:hypothetical protein
MRASVVQLDDSTGDPFRCGCAPEQVPSEQWIDVVSGDPSKSGSAFVLRIHNDAGYVCLPHTHPTDENIVVVQGSWSVGMGTRINLSTVQPLELGAYVLVPATMAQFCRSKTETIIQVHGVGPFSADMVDPLYELTDKGVNRMMSMGAPPQIVRDYPSSCFTFKIGDQVTGGAGDRTVVAAQCLAASGFTQYWIRKINIAHPFHVNCCHTHTTSTIPALVFAGEPPPSYGVVAPRNRTADAGHDHDRSAGQRETITSS